jgi:maleylpyruvate isomerase
VNEETARSVAGCRRAHATLNGVVDGLSEDDARRPSLLPGWSVGHVLSHLARNADSVVRRLEGALAGDVLDQYAGGAPGRAAHIEAGAGRSLSELAADVRDTSAAVDDLCDQMTDETWERMTRNLSGALQPASHVVFARWREVEVHLVDLGVGYDVDRWPGDLVAAWLPEVLAELPARSDPTRLLAWALGRAEPPALGDWG